MLPCLATLERRLGSGRPWCTTGLYFTDQLLNTTQGRTGEQRRKEGRAFLSVGAVRALEMTTSFRIKSRRPCSLCSPSHQPALARHIRLRTEHIQGTNSIRIPRGSHDGCPGYKWSGIPSVSTSENPSLVGSGALNRHVECQAYGGSYQLPLS